MVKKMITHEIISVEWNKDYPKPEDVKKNLENLPFITLTLENKHNKYWNYYNVAEKQLNRQNAELRKLTNILRNYYSKKPLPDKVIEQYNLKPLQINYNKNEIDLMIKSSDSYCELETEISSTKSLTERIKEILGFISGWRYHQKDFITMFRITNGLTRE
ncbi:MAG: hypothetical protein EBS24_08705 [Chitinophagia bacterium]|nr:hypothetical protein [Chitinophagia bacterium]